MELDLSRIVPDQSKTIRAGAIAPWSIPASRRYLDELLAVAPKLDFPVDIPFKLLDAAQVEQLVQGVSDSGFSGLRGFFRDIEARTHLLRNRLFLSRFRHSRTARPVTGHASGPRRLPSRLTAATSPSSRP